MIEDIRKPSLTPQTYSISIKRETQEKPKKNGNLKNKMS